MAAPLLSPSEWTDRWTALKDYLGGETADYLRCAGEAKASGDRTGEAYWNALARAGRQALARMTELEQER